MVSQVAAPDMPRQKRNDVVAKVDSEVIRKAKIIAAFRGISLAEYLTERLEPLVAVDLAAHIAGDGPQTGRARRNRKPAD